MSSTSYSSIKTLIVDDEPTGRRALSNLLQAHCPEVELVGEASTVPAAISLIEQLQPDLVFLDVELRPGTGFDILSHFTSIPFQIVFCTAYDHYAIKAFEFAAIHYLLKPIEIVELKKAIVRCSEMQETANPHITQLLEHWRTREINKISLPTREGFRFVEVTDILHLKGEGSYTKVTLTSGENILVSKRIGYFGKLLQGNMFNRIHQSWVINLRHLSRFENTKQAIIVLSDGKELPVARNRKQKLLDQLREIGIM